MAKEFNYEIFKKAAIDEIKKGGNFSGKDNVLLPMNKDFRNTHLSFRNIKHSFRYTNGSFRNNKKIPPIVTEQLKFFTEAQFNVTE